MQVSNRESTSISVNAAKDVCGCSGKTSLDNIVYPALRRLDNELASTQISPFDGKDAGYVPLSSDLQRTPEVVTSRDLSEVADIADTDAPTWTLGSTLVTEGVGSDSSELSDFLRKSHRTVFQQQPVRIAKGHTIQLRNASTSFQYFEHLHRTGPTRSGYWVVNVDLIHAFPNLQPANQTRIAILNALNDCYTGGGHSERTIRPLLFGPSTENVSERRVTYWYRKGSPPSVSVLPATVVPHDGEGWIFGASAVAQIEHDPPIRTSAVSPGDEVIIHRPFGALSLYAMAIDRGQIDKHSLETMCRDHRHVAETIAEFCPDYGEEFDPGKHLKLATDISGPGVRGINRLLNKSGNRLCLTNLPLLDREKITDGQMRWTVPDVTVETNGPLAMVGESTVIDRVKRRLDYRGSMDPTRLGKVTSGSGQIKLETDVEPYIEYVA